jgi:hypothetical protein
MKTTITLLLLAFFAIGVSAQLTLPEDFEAPEADTTWHQFANAGDDPANFGLADNPDDGGINTSAKCVMFTVLENADPWAGAWADAYDSVEFTEENHMMQMMVYKDVITDCGMKVEQGRGGESIEIKVPNTVTGEWELLTFDFTDGIGNAFQRLVLFPDFPETRETGSICYIDNIGFYSEPSSVKKVNNFFLSVYPNPANDAITIQYPGMRKVTISNMIGQRIRSLEFQLTDHKVADISSLESGVYFITLDTAEGIVSTKFVKQ